MNLFILMNLNSDSIYTSGGIFIYIFIFFFEKRAVYLYLFHPTIQYYSLSIYYQWSFTTLINFKIDFYLFLELFVFNMAFHELVVCFYFFNLEDLKWVGKRIDQDQVKEMKSTVAIE